MTSKAALPSLYLSSQFNSCLPFHLECGLCEAPSSPASILPSVNVETLHDNHRATGTRVGVQGVTPGLLVHGKCAGRVRHCSSSCSC